MNYLGSFCAFSLIFSIFVVVTYNGTNQVAQAQNTVYFEDKTNDLTTSQITTICEIITKKPDKNLVLTPRLLQYETSNKVMSIELVEDYFLVQELSVNWELLSETRVSKSSVIGERLMKYFVEYNAV